MNVGLDGGFAGFKLVKASKQTTYPAIVGSVFDETYGTNGHRSRELLQPRHVLYGQAAMNEASLITRVENRGWYTSKQFIDLMLAGLTELSAAVVVSADVVTCLPYDYMGMAGKVAKRLSNTYKVRRPDREEQTVVVNVIGVVPQGWAAFITQAHDTQGKRTEIIKNDHKYGMVDFGGHTTNFETMHGLRTLDGQCKSVDVGVWKVIGQVKTMIGNRYSQLHLNDHQLVEAVKAGKVMVKQREVSIASMVRRAVKPFAEHLVVQAQNLWEDGTGIDTIYLAGGGASLFGDAIAKAFRDITKPLDDVDLVYANAIGCYRYALKLAQKRQAQDG